MADRFPLIVDSSGTAAIKELESGDNLDLTGNGIVGVGTVALTNLTVGGGQGSDGQVLTSTGAGVQWETPSAGGITDVVSDTSPQLGGSLDVNGQSIVSASNGNIAITPNGSGKVVLDGLSWPTADGSSNYVLKTDGAGNLSWTAQGAGGDANQNAFSTVAVAGQTSVAADSTTDTITLVAGSNVTITTDDSADSVTIASAAPGIASLAADTSPQLGGALDVNGQDIVSTSNGDIELDPNGSGLVVFKGNSTKGAGQFKLNCEANSHGITIKGPPHSAAASYTLTLPNDDGSADQVLKTDGSGVLSWADPGGGGGGGVWNVLSSQTLSSSVSSVTFTGVTGYKVYKLIMTDINQSSNATADQIQLSSDNGSNFATFGISSTALRYNSGSTSQTINNDFYQSNKLPLMYSYNEYNNDEKHHVEVTIFGLNDSSFTYIHSRLLSSWGWNVNDIGANETYARTTDSGGQASFNAFKVETMAGGTYDGGTFTLYGLANS